MRWLAIGLLCGAALLVNGVEVMLPMRDGVQLHTDIDFPLVKSYTNLTAVMDRSPYGANALELMADIFLLFGFVAVRQDFRGTGQSQGSFALWHDAANDTYDTMEWISKQSWSNGKIYTIGASADGIEQFAALLGSPPGLVGQMILVATARGRQTMFPGGAYRQALIEGWLNKTVPGQAASLLEEVKNNEAPGAWWNALNDTNQYYRVNFPSVMWAGWYDIFLMGNLVGFDGYQKGASTPGRSNLVVDPLGHCQKAHVYFPKNLIEGRIILPLFLAIDMVLGKPPAENVKPVTFYVMGANDSNPDTPGNYWTTLDDWPTFVPTPYYFHGDNSMSPNAPAQSSSSTTYVFDPTNPVPTIGGNNLMLSCGPLDQRPTESRSDVVLFTTDVLTTALPVTGPLMASLYVSSSNVDTDFTVKLTDVYPDGTSRLIQDGIIRMRWRNENNPTPILMEPGTVYNVMVSLWNTSYVFPPGHRVRVAVSSSNYPRFGVNPNTGVPLNQTSELVSAKNTIYHSAEYPSAFIFPVVQLADMPEVPLLLDEHARRYESHLGPDASKRLHEIAVHMFDRL